MTFSQRIGLNLIQEAKIELDFLALVDEYPSLYGGPVLKNAIRRYEVFWLPLAAKQGSDSRLLAAPLDIAWVWHLHMLAPHDYEHDCINIVSRVVDHTPMNRYQRQQGLQNARYLWEIAYPAERFEVDLNQPTAFVMPNLLKIRYNIEKAADNQVKFYYQVSLPHFSDSKFLASAVEGYEHHLNIKSQHPHVSVVPSIDVDLIWHSHLHHPLNYKQVTKEMFGVVLLPENHQAYGSLGSMGHNSQIGTGVVWPAVELERARSGLVTGLQPYGPQPHGLQFDKPGTAFRGDPPKPRPPRLDGFYANLGRLQYVISILQIGVVNVDVTKTFSVRLHNPADKMILSQKIKGGTCVNLTTHFVVNSETLHSIRTSLYQKRLFGEKNLGSFQTNLLSYLDSLPYGGTAPELHFTIDVPFGEAGSIVRLAAKINPPSIEGYRFKVQPDMYFKKIHHPSLVLSFPQSILSPSDFAKTYLPCEHASHTLLDCRGREAFKCRVIHSTEGLLSAVEIISLHGLLVASAHTVSPNILPEQSSIEDDNRCVSFIHMEGERAMLIRSRKDWGICIGKWQRGKWFNRSAGQVEIRLLKLHGKRGWYEVRKYEGGLYLICLDSSIFVHVDLKRGLIVMSPSAQDIPEIIALAFSVSILYLLCKPYSPTPGNEPSPSFHKKAKNDKVTPMLLAAGYKSATVPTNVYLIRSIMGSAASGPSLDGAGRYDLDSESGLDWISELTFKKEEVNLWLSMSGVSYENEGNSSGWSRGGFGGSGGDFGGDGGGDGGGGGGDGGGGGGGGGDGGGGGG